MTKKKRHISMFPGDQKRLSEELGVSESYTYDALYYRRNGDVPKQIRDQALSMGGQYVDPEFVPNCRTEYLEGQIRQTFAAGVVLTIDRETGKAVITVGDEVVRRVDEPLRMSRWNILAREAQQLSVQRIINS